LVSNESLLHFFGARANLLERVIRPAISEGRDIIADRFDESTFAYQVVAFEHRKLEKAFWEIRSRLIIDNDLEPDLYIYIDVSVEVGMRRRSSDKVGLINHLDQKSHNFHRAVGEGLMEFFRTVPHAVVEGNQPPHLVLRECLKVLQPHFGDPIFSA